MNTFSKLRTAILVVITLISAARSAIGETQCELDRIFLQPDVENIGGVPTVIQRKVLFDSQVVVFSEAMRVNTDGTLRSYSAVDPWGTLCNPKVNPKNARSDAMIGCAMNNICNGTDIVAPDKAGGLETIKGDQCSRLIEEFIRIRDANWHPTNGSRLAPYGFEMRNSAEPCLDPTNRFLVSTASTRSGLSGGPCSQAVYLSALVPSIVVPRCWTASYRRANPHECKKHLPEEIQLDIEPGDLVTLLPRLGGSPVFAVIGDTGPHRKLGEASVGLLMKAAGRSEPRFTKQTYALDGQSFHVLIFRNSRFSGVLTPANTQAMERKAREKFAAWAGDLTKSQTRLRACGERAR